MAKTRLSLFTLHRRAGHAGLASDAAAEASALGIRLGSESFGIVADLHEAIAAALLGDGDAAQRLTAAAALTSLPIPSRWRAPTARS
jgi:hypothetical protein